MQYGVLLLTFPVVMERSFQFTLIYSEASIAMIQFTRFLQNHD